MRPHQPDLRKDWQRRGGGFSHKFRDQEVHAPFRKIEGRPVANAQELEKGERILDRASSPQPGPGKLIVAAVRVLKVFKAARPGHPDNNRPPLRTVLRHCEF